ncbi:MAG: hypothetical protein FWC22_06005 [Treponema sp.]|nr:hypothetical protein [Treponema sp.]
MLKKICLFLFIIFFPGGGIWAQDFGFGFGDDSDTAANTGRNFSASVNGEIKTSFTAYVKDFSKGLDELKLGDVFSGKLNFSAGTSFADGFINLNLTPSKSPVAIDEAFLRVYFSGFEFEAGLRKLTWGKADSFGVLDVINPLDYSQLTDLSNLMNFKIARPLLHLSYRFGSFTKLEGVFVPNFEPMRFAQEGRWAQSQMSQLNEQLLYLQSIGVEINIPKDTSTLNYMQAGLRFTTTIGSADFGVQYYYGRMTRPAVAMIYDFSSLMPVPASINFSYNPYHQIGIDWAQVLYGFNIRAELAANITGDLSGDNGEIYNPHIAWSLGFDRNLFWGINLNIQCNQSIRLMNSKISAALPLSDTEADTDITSTQIIAALSKMFLRDQLEVRAAVFWEAEARDIMFIPSVIWTKDALSAELSCGIFAGDSGGQFGQYKDNCFVKAALTFSF